MYMIWYEKFSEVPELKNVVTQCTSRGIDLSGILDVHADIYIRVCTLDIKPNVHGEHFYISWTNMSIDLYMYHYVHIYIDVHVFLNIS